MWYLPLASAVSAEDASVVAISELSSGTVLSVVAGRV
jgi:hypothetical protein